MRTRSPNSCSCRPGLAEDAIQPVLPSSRKREYSRLVFTYNKAISIPFSDILTLVFLKIIFFTIFVGNISKWEKKAIIYVHHCLLFVELFIAHMSVVWAYVSLWLCNFVSLYLCILVSLYLCIFVTLYLCMFGCLLQEPIRLKVLWVDA